ncbi:hypothetical protein CVT24_005643 [Panaeolus cyanescens]|uniref:DNA polymerase delta catalytic subunit n=1 Tax=Panaeolus cyanescens TaxID=181874 RepID=A0A409V9J3_9AGAR|nr:hypothetical protein CVT24_005643 [Panaeolus cyanescens]
MSQYSPNRGLKRPLGPSRTEPNLDELDSAKRPRISGPGAASESQIGQRSTNTQGNFNNRPFADVLKEWEEIGNVTNISECAICFIDPYVVCFALVEPEAGQQRRARPALGDLDPNHKPIIFQQLDVEELVDPRTGESIFGVFGVTEDQNSVMARVTNVKPYFFVACPNGFTDDDVIPFIQHLNRGVCKYKGFGWTRETFNSDVGRLAPKLRFMIDTGAVSMNWIEVPKRRYDVVPQQSKLSTCQLEIEVSLDNLVVHEPEGDWAKIAPLRILSLDLECFFAKERGPDLAKDPIHQISNMVTLHGTVSTSILRAPGSVSDANSGEERPFIRNIFTVKSCDPIVGSQVLSFDDESQMLRRWGEFVKEVDPDVIVGYNSTGFDLPMTLQRSAFLRLDRLPLSRIREYSVEIKKKKFASKGYPNGRMWNDIKLPGRLLFDVMRFMHRDRDLTSHGIGCYTLNNVARIELGQRKEADLGPKINDLQNGDSTTRRELAVYCLKDAYLPNQIISKSGLLVQEIETALGSGQPFHFLLASIEENDMKRRFEVFKKAYRHGYIISDTGNMDQLDSIMSSKTRQEAASAADLNDTSPRSSIDNDSLNLSFLSTETRDGILCNDTSREYHTRSSTLDSRTIVKNWRMSLCTPEEQDALLKKVTIPLMELIDPDDTDIAKLVFEKSEMTSQLLNFIKTSQEEAVEMKKSKWYQKGKVEVIPFSKVKQADLDRIGVLYHDAADRFEQTAVETMLHRYRNGSLMRFKEYWNTPSRELVDYLHYMDLSIKLMPHVMEAASRRHIEIVFAGLMDIIKNLQYEQILVPEVSARPNFADTPQRFATTPVYTTEGDPGQGKAVFFTGSIDYGVATRQAGQEFSFPLSPAMTEHIERLTGDNHVDTLFLPTAGAVGSSAVQPLHVLFVEAKRPAISRHRPSATKEERDQSAIKLLRTHEPQVVAEAMAGVNSKMRQLKESELQGHSRMTRLQIEDLKMTGVVWCLTDGIYWVFGLVAYVPQGNQVGRGKWHNIRLGHAKNERLEVNHNDNKELKYLMFLLLALTTINPQNILEHIELYEVVVADTHST